MKSTSFKLNAPKLSKISPGLGSPCGLASGWQVEAGDTTITVCNIAAIPTFDIGTTPSIQTTPYKADESKYSGLKWKLPDIKFPDIKWPWLKKQFASTGENVDYYDKVRAYLAGQSTPNASSILSISSGKSANDSWKIIGKCVAAVGEKPWISQVWQWYDKYNTALQGKEMDDATLKKASDELEVLISSKYPEQLQDITQYFENCY